jgi:hypothetical protein
MVAGNHAFIKTDNHRLGLVIDFGSTGAVLVIAIWYLFVPLVWGAATSGREVMVSFWLTWYPIGLAAFAAAIGGVCGYYLRFGVKGCFGVKGWFSPIGRVAFFAGVSFIGIAVGQRVKTIQQFRETQAAYLDRCVGYIQKARQKQQELMASLGADERALGTFLDRREIGPGIQEPIAALRNQLEIELDTLNNLPLAGREQAAEIESARAHKVRARGISSNAYIESLAKQKPGPELLGSQNGLDPMLQAEAVALAAKIVETEMAGW